MKGIILAGGTGSRLSPCTNVVSKQLLPVFNKPMIYYSLSVLMINKIREILIISTSKDILNFKKLLGNGHKFGVKLNYKIQKKPNGIAEAFKIGRKFIGNSNCTLILGDNIFFGSNLKIVQNSDINDNGAYIYLYRVANPRDYGIAEISKKDNKIKKIVEKPTNPKSNLAVTGLYVYNNEVIEFVKKLKPSKRGELEITDLNNIYLKKNKLNYKILENGFAWLDTGTHESLYEAASFVQTIEHRQGIQIGCLEEISLKNNWINKSYLKKISQTFPRSSYYNYIRKIINEN